MNLKRRNFLKFLLVGAFGFILGKIFDPLISSRDSALIEKETLFKNFRAVETKKELTFYDRKGKAIFAIEKD